MSCAAITLIGERRSMQDEDGSGMGNAGKLVDKEQRGIKKEKF